MPLRTVALYVPVCGYQGLKLLKHSVYLTTLAQKDLKFQRLDGIFEDSEQCSDNKLGRMSESNFFPSNAFLRRRRKKALLRVNDRGGGWKTCILASCRACLCVCARVLYVRACSFIKLIMRAIARTYNVCTVCIYTIQCTQSVATTSSYNAY